MDAPGEQGTLGNLLEQAEQARDAAQRRLAEAARALRMQRAQATQLDDYRIETEERWALQAGRASTPEMMLCYRGFMDRLEQAIGQQHHVCAQAERALAHAREALAACELRVASVRKLIERRQEAVRLAEQRLDQKRVDEAGQRAAWLQRRSVDTHHH